MVLQTIDYLAIAIYALVIIAFGVVLHRKASGGLDDYFLGGRRLPWYLLGTSGMSNWFDLTGTMVITSFIFLIGPRALFIEFRGGAVLILVFLLCFTAKWHRRSGVMTGAEWMQFRFGNGKDADAARLLTALVSILPVIGMIAYLLRGTGQFLSLFFPFSPNICAIGFAMLAVVYVASAGFYGVVAADILQSVLVITAAIALSFIVYNMFVPVEVEGVVISAADSLGNLATSVTGNANWADAMPSWHVEMPNDPEYHYFQFLVIAMGFYMVQQSISGLASGADQKYFAAKSDKECGKLNALVSILISVRWPMMIGVAILGLMTVNKYFNADGDLERHREVEAIIQTHRINSEFAKLQANPAANTAVATAFERSFGADWTKMSALDDSQRTTALRILNDKHDGFAKTWLELTQSVDMANPALTKYLSEKLGAEWKTEIANVGKMMLASDLIRKEHPELTKASWHNVTTLLVNDPQYKPELRAKIEGLFGDGWQKKIAVVGFHGTTDPERILPAVIRENVPSGWLGVLLVTLIAVSMSTFGSTVNAATAYAVKDLYQRWLRPNAGRRELISASWMTTIIIAGIGYFLSLIFTSINDVWDWIIMSVTTGLFVPGFLRMYWWRMNGWGVAFGMASGGIAAIAQRVMQQNDILLFGWDWAPWVKFGFVAVFAFAATIGGCMLTKATPIDTLVHFYKKTRPFGFWGPVRKYLTDEQKAYIDGENRRDIASLPFAFMYQVTLFLLPMLFIIHSHDMFYKILPIFIGCIIVLYLLWYRNLREDRKMELEPGIEPNLNQ